MKKTSFLLAAILLTGTAFAQVQSGSKFVGMHAGASLSKPDAFNKTTTYHASPSIGYFLTPHLMIGISGGYAHSVNEQQRQQAGTGYNSYYNYAGTVKTTSWNVGPIARYYVPVGEKFAFFAESAFGLSSAKVKAESNAVYYSGDGQGGQPAGSPWGVPTGGAQISSSQEMKQGFLYGSLAPGVVFFPTPRIGVELKASMINYLYNGETGSQAEARFSLSDTSIGLGFYF